jgi:uncharacterized protein YdaU (DUF1376 family)
MPVFTDALIGDTTHLSTEEFGAYVLILVATWRNNGEALPDCDARMARICRVTAKRWRQRLRPILSEFFNTSDGFWHQKRLEKEFAYVEKLAQVSRDNGAKGGRPKSLNNHETENPAGEPGTNPEANPPYPYPLREETSALQAEEVSSRAPSAHRAREARSNGSAAPPWWATRRRSPPNGRRNRRDKSGNDRPDVPVVRPISRAEAEEIFARLGYPLRRGEAAQPNL